MKLLGVVVLSGSPVPMGTGAVGQSNQEPLAFGKDMLGCCVTASLPPLNPVPPTQLGSCHSVLSVIDGAAGAVGRWVRVWWGGGLFALR